ncbi:MAG: deoxyribodipyrimidine photo-lyase, partial [Acidimicrobiales bacterium]
MPTTILWFRRDLRLSDHSALIEAVHAAGDEGEVVPIFCVDGALWGPSGDNRRAFLVGCLEALDADVGGRLAIRHGDPVTVIPKLAQECDATQVFVSADFGPYGTERDDAVEQALSESERELVRVGSPYAVEPGTVLNG